MRPHPLFRLFADGPFEGGLQVGGGGEDIGVLVVCDGKVDFLDAEAKAHPRFAQNAARKKGNAEVAGHEGGEGGRGRLLAEEGHLDARIFAKVRQHGHAAAAFEKPHELHRRRRVFGEEAGRVIGSARVSQVGVHQRVLHALVEARRVPPEPHQPHGRDFPIALMGGADHQALPLIGAQNLKP